MTDGEQSNPSSEVILNQPEGAPVTPARWQQIKQLFVAALDIAPDERCAFLLQACGPDVLLRAEVESLLAEEHVVDVGAHFGGPAELVTEDAMIGRRLGAYEV